MNYFASSYRPLRIVLCTVFLLGLISLSITPAHPTAAQSLNLTVHADKSLGPISPYVYGANHGPWAILSPDVLPLADAAGITFLRFPGGNWGDENDLSN